jgi:hypothetical protein
MSDVPTLSEREMADLCALADGTLPSERRAELEARVSASPELQELLERQRQAVLATRGLETDREPSSLRAAVAARRRAPRSSVVRPRSVLAVVLVGAAAVVAALALTRGPGAPTVADAARLASRSPNGPAPTATSATKLAIDIEGLPFPNLARAYGWRAVGVRRGHVDGRDTVVVYYAKGARRAAYAIVARPTLTRPSGARATTVAGVRYDTLPLNHRLVVTWRRAGHTCVLVGDATRAELLMLASWPLSGTR